MRPSAYQNTLSLLLTLELVLVPLSPAAVLAVAEAAPAPDTAAALGAETPAPTSTGLVASDQAEPKSSASADPVVSLPAGAREKIAAPAPPTVPVSQSEETKNITTASSTPAAAAAEPASLSAPVEEPAAPPVVQSPDVLIEPSAVSGSVSSTVESVSTSTPVTAEEIISPPAAVATTLPAVADSAGQVFRVKDAFTDVAVLPGGRAVYRMYLKPRAVYRTETGELAVRPRGWNYFHETAGSRLGETLVVGYRYTVPLTAGQAVTVQAGEMTIDGENSHPRPANFLQYVKEDATVTEYHDLYSGVDVRFRDVGMRRYRSLVIKEAIPELAAADKVTFWEEYQLPPYTRLTDIDNRALADESRTRHTSVIAHLPSGQALVIGGATIFDASGREETYLDLEQVIRFEPTAGRLAIGLEVPGDYLRQNGRRYPVTIDPMFSLCDEQAGAHGTESYPCGFVYDFYLRPTPQGDKVSSNDLFAGFTAPNYTRVPVLKFQSNFHLLPYFGTITGARAWIFYSRPGSGTATNNIAVSAREISTAWDYSSISYNLIRDGLQTIDSRLVSPTKNNTWYYWDVTEAVQRWSSGVPNYGFVLEPMPPWTSGGTPSWPDRLLIFSADENVNTGPYMDISISYPDLLSDSHTINTFSASPGEQLTASVAVKNASNGNNDHGSTFAYYFDPGACATPPQPTNQVGTLATPALAPGASVSHSFAYTIPPGTADGSYCFSYWIDTNDDVIELNENNNQKGFTITVADGASPPTSQADLTANPFSVDSSKIYYTGQSAISIPVTIKNLGGTDANNVGYRLDVRSGTNGNAYSLGSLNPPVLNLPANSSQTVTLSGVPSETMPYNDFYLPTLVLNPGINNIPESNYDNNVIEATNTVIIQRWSVNGGGAGSSPTDSDGDSFSDQAEVGGGSNPNGAQSMNLYDPGTYRSRRSLSTDKADRVAIQSAQAAPPAAAQPQVATGGSEGADPVNLRTGAFEFEQTDFTLRGRGLPINFTRTYNSKLSDWNSRLGRGWSHSYDIFYYEDPSTRHIQLYLGGTLATLFTTGDSGATYRPPPGQAERLTRDPATNVVTYRTPAGLAYVFSPTLTSDHIAFLDKIIDTNGNVTRLGYTTVRDLPLLTSITDASGRKIVFRYPDPASPTWDKVWLMEDLINIPYQRNVSYSYDTQFNLGMIDTNNNYQEKPEWGSNHSFTYDAAGRMLTYTDPRGTILYNEYDADGRVRRQYEHNPRADGSDPTIKRLVYEISYDDDGDPAVPGSTHCTLAKNFRDATAFYSEQLCFNADELKIYRADGLGNVERWAYDANGMVSSSTDQRGNITGYVHDSRRRLVKEILPNTADWHTEISYLYEDSFDKLTQKTETAIPLAGGNPLTRVANYTIDPGSGNLLSVSDVNPAPGGGTSGGTETFQYDAFGNVATSTNKLGGVTVNQYDAPGNYLIASSMTVTQADGTTQKIGNRYTYDVYGNPTSETDARYATPQIRTSYEYDIQGNRRQATEVKFSNASTTYRYDFENHLVQERRERDLTINYTYDTDLNASLLSVQQTDGKETITNSREYDYVGNLIAEVDPLGHRTSYRRDAANRVDEKQTPVDTVIYAYYPDGRLRSETNSLGQKTEYLYDSRGNRTEVRRYLDATAYVSNQFVYDGFNRLIRSVDSNGQATGFAYDLLNRLTEKTDPLNNHYTYRYDAAGNKIGERRPRAQTDTAWRNEFGDSTTFVYDQAGRLIKEVNAHNKETRRIYDANNNLTNLIDRQNKDGTENTRDSSYSFNSLNLMDYWEQPDNSWGYHSMWDKAGHITQTYDFIPAGQSSSAGRAWFYDYDTFNRQTQISELTGDSGSWTSTFFGYDRAGNKTSTTYPDSTIERYRYDEGNRLTDIIDTASSAQHFVYDAVGNKISATDRLNSTTTFKYDKLNRLIEEKNPAGVITGYTYDGNGNRLSVTVGDRVTRFEYDELNRLKLVAYPDIFPNDAIERYTYDADGNRVSVTRGKFSTTTFDYDALERVTAKHLPDGTNVTYTYDNWDNVLSVSDASGTTSYVYNVRNWPTSETKTYKTLPGKSFTIQRTYHPDGQVATLTDAGGQTLTYAYYKHGPLKSVANSATILASYLYNKLNRPTEIGYGNSVTTTLGYDQRHRVNNITVKDQVRKVLWEEGYAYDAEDNRTALLRSGATSTLYGYDLLYQLTSVDYTPATGTPELSFQYDNYGNRTAFTAPGVSVSYDYYPATNHLKSLTYNNRLTITPLFNVHGELVDETISRGSGRYPRINSYQWDGEGRLTRFGTKQVDSPAFMPQPQSETVAFGYDDSGNRVRKTTANGLQTTGETYYLYDGSRSLHELDGAGTITKTIIAGLETIAEIDGQGKITYLNQDVLGSTVLLTDDTGAVVQEYEYDPFGSLRGASGSAETTHLFTGQEFDPESSLYFFHARYYNPVLGRFISRDPVLGKDGLPLTRNGYIYVLNNPFKYVDPTGRGEQSVWEKLWDVSEAVANAFLDVGTMIMPGVSDIRDAYEVRFKQDLVTNRKLTETEQALTGFGATAPLLLSGREVRLGAKLIKKVDDVVEVTEKMLKNSEAFAGKGTVVVLRQAERLAKQYGGEAKDWIKMTTREVFKDADGAKYQIHYYINKVINAVVEAKKKFP